MVTNEMSTNSVLYHGAKVLCLHNYFILMLQESKLEYCITDTNGNIRDNDALFRVQINVII